MGLMDAWKNLTYFTTTFREHLMNRLEEMPKDEEQKDFDLMAFIDQLEQNWGPTKKSKQKKSQKKRARKVKENFQKSKREKLSPSVQRKEKKHSTSIIKKEIKHPVESLLSELNDWDIENNFASHLHLLSRTGAVLAESIRSSRQELPDTYTSFAKKCHEAALCDTSDHLFLSFCGLEVLCSSLLQNDWQALQTIIPQLILDWHGMAEQTRNATHLLLYKTPNQTHHLVTLSKKIGEYSDWREQNLTDEQHFLQDLDNGQMWVRFSKSSQWNLRTSEREEGAKNDEIGI